MDNAIASDCMPSLNHVILFSSTLFAYLLSLNRSYIDPVILGLSYSRQWYVEFLLNVMISGIGIE